MLKRLSLMQNTFTKQMVTKQFQQYWDRDRPGILWEHILYKGGPDSAFCGTSEEKPEQLQETVPHEAEFEQELAPC